MKEVRKPASLEACEALAVAAQQLAEAIVATVLKAFEESPENEATMHEDEHRGSRRKPDRAAVEALARRKGVRLLP